MARLDQRHPEGVDGDWFADTRCIGCDVARHYAPDLIGADEEGEADQQAAPYATGVLRGDAVVEVAPGVRAVPVPGHTKGSVVFVDDVGHLFAGDSLSWSEGRGTLTVFGSVTWYSWEESTASMARLADEADFSWVLPGHGKWGQAPSASIMDRHLRQMAADMAQHSAATWDHRPVD